MLTPFRENGEVDYNGLEHLVHWYIKKGADGLFAVCQSSEMFFLTLEERVKIMDSMDPNMPLGLQGEQCMSYKEFDLSDYINALEDFKSDQAEEVIKNWEASQILISSFKK